MPAKQHGGKREGAGRPPLDRDPDDPRPRLIRVYASETELAYIAARTTPEERAQVLLQHAQRKGAQ